LKIITLLGSSFILDPNERESNNWHKITATIKTIITQHQNRKLTFSGKIQITKTLLVPQIMHKAKVLAPPQNIINQINYMFFKFLFHPNLIKNLERKSL